MMCPSVAGDVKMKISHACLHSWRHTYNWACSNGQEIYSRQKSSKISMDIDLHSVCVYHMQAHSYLQYQFSAQLSIRVLLAVEGEEQVICSPYCRLTQENKGQLDCNQFTLAKWLLTSYADKNKRRMIQPVNILIDVLSGKISQVIGYLMCHIPDSAQTLYVITACTMHLGISARPGNY